MVLKSLWIHKGHKHERLPTEGPSGQGAKPPAIDQSSTVLPLHILTFTCGFLEKEKLSEGEKGYCCSVGMVFQFCKVSKFKRPVVQKCVYNYHYCTLKNFLDAIFCVMCFYHKFLKKRNLSETLFCLNLLACAMF